MDWWSNSVVSPGSGRSLIARRAIVFARYRLGQGKWCVNRVRLCVDVAFWLKGVIIDILHAYFRRKNHETGSSWLKFKNLNCAQFGFWSRTRVVTFPPEICIPKSQKSHCLAKMIHQQTDRQTDGRARFTHLFPWPNLYLANTIALRAKMFFVGFQNQNPKKIYRT